MYVTDTIKAIGTIGFGVEHFDRQNESFFKNGAFKIESFSMFYDDEDFSLSSSLICPLTSKVS